MPGYEHDRIASLEERLALRQQAGAGASISDLGMLADLYLQADSYVPALETIDRLLSLPEARTLTPSQRAVLESKAISCRLAQGNCQAALAHCREVLRTEDQIEAIPGRGPDRRLATTASAASALAGCPVTALRNSSRSRA